MEMKKIRNACLYGHRPDQPCQQCRLDKMSPVDRIVDNFNKAWEVEQQRLDDAWEAANKAAPQMENPQ